MKSIAVVAALLMLGSSPALSRGGGGHAGSHSSGTATSHISTTGSHTISGYINNHGTYVQPSHATNPDGSKSNNYSTRGNVNPYTGKAGTKSIVPNSTPSGLRSRSSSVAAPVTRSASGYGGGTSLVAVSALSSVPALAYPSGIESPTYDRAGPPPGVAVLGKSSSQVERLARQQGTCSDEPTGALLEKGAGYEIYSVSCRDGRSALYRCEFGQCSASR